MNIKVLKEYLSLCGSVGAIGTPIGFYKFVEDNYPREVKRLNMELILKLWRNI